MQGLLMLFSGRLNPGNEQMKIWLDEMINEKVGLQIVPLIDCVFCSRTVKSLIVIRV